MSMWARLHFEHPIPSREEKLRLAKYCGKDYKQAHASLASLQLPVLECCHDQ